MSSGHFKKIDLRTLAHERVEADRVLSHGDLVETETSVLVWLDHESELEGLERAIDDGELELTWQAGGIERAVRRVYRHDAGSRALERLLTLPVAQSITSLVIDLVGFDDWPPGINEPVQVEAAEVLNLVDRAAPLLTEISFTWSIEPELPTVLVERALTNLKKTRPMLKSTLEGLIRHCSTAWFDRGGERVTLENGWTLPGLLEVDHRFWLSPVSPSLRLNGHRVKKALRLLPGDLVTAPGLHLRFEVE